MSVRKITPENFEINRLTYDESVIFEGDWQSGIIFPNCVKFIQPVIFHLKDTTSPIIFVKSIAAA